MVRGEDGIPLKLKQGIGPHLQMRFDTRGSSQVVAGNSAFITSCDGDLWAPLCCMKGVMPPLESGEGTRDCLLGAVGENASSLIDRVISWVFSSCGRRLGIPLQVPKELREPLVLPQGSQVSIQVVRASAGFIWSHDRGIGPQSAWKGESQGVSSGAEGSLDSLEL